MVSAELLSWRGRLVLLRLCPLLPNIQIPTYICSDLSWFFISINLTKIDFKCHPQPHKSRFQMPLLEIDFEFQFLVWGGVEWGFKLTFYKSGKEKLIIGKTTNQNETEYWNSKSGTRSKSTVLTCQGIRWICPCTCGFWSNHFSRTVLLVQIASEELANLGIKLS